MKKVVAIGGGTGTYTVLSGLAKYDLALTAIVSMMDSGGSNRILRDEFGLLPTSDIRQCLVALAKDNGENEVLRKLFTYRYNQGTGISGMTFGNLFMAALTDIYGSQKKALRTTQELLGIKGNIYPVTYDNSQLLARYDNGTQILGEHYIDEPDSETGKHRIVELELVPEAKANKDAARAIMKADIIVIGPGDLFTSTICNFVVDGIANAIQNTKAKKVFVMNLMTKFGQTNSYTAKMHIAEIEKYLGKDSIDYCLINRRNSVPNEVIKKYKEENAIVVKDDLKATKTLNVIRTNLITGETYIKPKSDKLNRSLIRHDSNRLAKEIAKLLF